MIVNRAKNGPTQDAFAIIASRNIRREDYRMAKNNYAEMDTYELQRLADDREKRRAAVAQLSKSDPEAVKALSIDERIALNRANEQARVDAWHQSIVDAKERALKSMLASASRDPNRYGSERIKAATAYLQQQERNRRFDAEQETARTVSENEMKGKIGAGSEAAHEHARAEIEKARSEHGYVDDGGKYQKGSRERIAEQEAAAKKYLADKEAEARRYGVDAEHGVIGTDGKVTPGSRERVAKIQAETTAQQAELQRQNELEKQRLVNEGNVEAAKTAGAAKVVAAEARSEQTAAARRRRFDEMALSGKFMMAGITADKWKNMSEEEREKIRNQFFGVMDVAAEGETKKKGLGDYEVK